MKAVTAETMRRLDAVTIRDYQIPGRVLMERAGKAVADAIAAQFLRRQPASHVPVCLCAGKGNNGGDAFVTARHLKMRGVPVCIRTTCFVADYTGDARSHVLQALADGIVCRECPDPVDWASTPGDAGDAISLIVDGILGTGFKGPVGGTACAAIEWINRMGRHIPVVSIDLPSGLNADTGTPEPIAVRADLTITLGLPKTGLLLSPATDHVGRVCPGWIGIPDALIAECDDHLHLITRDDCMQWMPARPATSHKGTFGHLLVIGGSTLFTGAPILAGLAALRSGVGLLTMLVPGALKTAATARMPEAMVAAPPDSSGETLSVDALRALPRPPSAFQAVIAGPGMGQTPATRTLLDNLLQTPPDALVLDADALNLLAGQSGTLRACSAPRRVLTPHPGEAARLLGCDIEMVQQDRLSAARQLAELTGSTVVLKGAGTVVTAPGEPPWINRTGNPGMAKGGMGDVLAGIIGALLAQGLCAMDAARLGVFLHGTAGDCAAGEQSQPGLTAQDVIACLPAAWHTLACR